MQIACQIFSINNRIKTKNLKPYFNIKFPKLKFGQVFPIFNQKNAQKLQKTAKK